MYGLLLNSAEKQIYRFNASRLSGNILREYLTETLQGCDSMKMFPDSVPEPYSSDMDMKFEFNTLLRMSTMAVKNWKECMSSSLDKVYLNDDVVTDAQYFYDAWSTVHEETGNHIVQKYFFKMMFEICKEMNSRGVVQVNSDGRIRVQDIDLPVESTSVQAEPIQMACPWEKYIPEKADINMQDTTELEATSPVDIYSNSEIGLQLFD